MNDTGWTQLAMQLEDVFTLPAMEILVSRDEKSQILAKILINKM